MAPRVRESVIVGIVCNACNGDGGSFGDVYVVTDTNCRCDIGVGIKYLQQGCIAYGVLAVIIIYSQGVLLANSRDLHVLQNPDKI